MQLIKGKKILCRKEIRLINWIGLFCLPSINPLKWEISLIVWILKRFEHTI